MLNGWGWKCHPHRVVMVAVLALLAGLSIGGPTPAQAADNEAGPQISAAASIPLPFTTMISSLQLDSRTGTLFLYVDGAIHAVDTSGQLIGALPAQISPQALAVGATKVAVINANVVEAVNPSTLQRTTLWTPPARWSVTNHLASMGADRFLFLVESLDPVPPGQPQSLLCELDAGTGQLTTTPIPDNISYFWFDRATTDGRFLVDASSKLWSYAPPTLVPLGPAAGASVVALDSGHYLARTANSSMIEVSLPDQVVTMHYADTLPVGTALVAGSPRRVIATTGNTPGSFYQPRLYLFDQGDDSPIASYPLPGVTQYDEIVDTDGTTVYLGLTVNGVPTLLTYPVPPPSPLGNTGEYQPLSPFRLLDTRTGIGRQDTAAPLRGGERIRVQVAGVGTVPSDAVAAVVVNLTVTEPTAGTYVALYPSGGAEPYVSNINVPPRTTRANLAVVKVGADGAIIVLNAAGSAHVILDVQGWFTTALGPSGVRFKPVTPTRILDGRYQGPGALLGAGATGYLDVASICPGAQAAALNVTALATTEDSYITVFPPGAPLPFASNINVGAYGVAPNLVFTQLVNNRATLYNAAGRTYVLADLLGCFYPFVDAEAGRFFTAPLPYRAFDTRSSIGPLGPARYLSTSLVGGGSPLPPAAAGGGAVLANLTATEPTEDGVVVLYPSDLGAQPPQTSTLNFTATQTVANLAITPLGSDGRVHVANYVGNTHVIMDITGWFSNASLP